MGLNPIRLDNGLLEEIEQIASKYADRCDMSRSLVYRCGFRNEQPSKCSCNRRRRVVGSNVVARLLQKGHEVSIFDNFEMGLRDYVDTRSTRIIEGDLRDEEAINNAVAGHDAVIHLATYGNVIDS